MSLAIENDCLTDDADGAISACPYLYASDTNGAAVNCPTRASPIDEAVTGRLDKLPGCIEVTDDPAGAPPSSMTCPSSVAPPYVTPTVDSVPQYTVQPAVGDRYPAGTFQEYLGCYNDSSNGLLALGGTSTVSDSMDIATCQAYCKTAGYRLSGVEYSTECCTCSGHSPWVLFISVLSSPSLLRVVLPSFVTSMRSFNFLPKSGPAQVCQYAFKNGLKDIYSFTQNTPFDLYSTPS